MRENSTQKPAPLHTEGYVPADMFKGYVPKAQGDRLSGIAQETPPTPPNKGTSGKKS